MEYCKFCDFLENDAKDILYCFDNFFVTLDSCPSKPGHFLIVPNRHVMKFGNLSLEEVLEFQKLPEKTLDMFSSFDFLSRYNYFLEQIPPYEKKMYKRCCEAIEFLGGDYSLDRNKDFSLGWNQGKNSGQEHEHLHIHIIPAYEDSPNKRGIRGLLYDFGVLKN